MNTKRKVLELLENNSSEYISGENIARRLEISRNAVWKTICALKSDGYEIEAVRNRGYRIGYTCDVISSERISRYLDNAELFSIDVRKSVSSTNTLLMKAASNGAKEGSILISEMQTAGKGRKGRDFCSPEKSGLYMSVLLRPQISAEDSTFITTAAAVALCIAIEKVCNVSPQIKWVNDIFLNGKKVSGILTEASIDFENMAVNYAVLGVGINVYEPQNGFPKELADIAGPVCKTVSFDLKNKLAACFINEFWHIYSKYDKEKVCAEYRKRCFIIGKDITVIRGNSKYEAKAVGINDDFSLVVECAGGELKSLNSGEISIKL